MHAARWSDIATGGATEASSLKTAKGSSRDKRTVRRHVFPDHYLILMIGVAGTGKTTLANEILTRFPAVYLDNNLIVDAFFPETRHGRDYQRLRPNFYRALYAIAEANLRVGNSVLLDVPHVKEIQIPSWRRFIKRLAKRTNSRPIFIRCLCSEEVLRSRLQSRGERRDQWKLQHWREFLTEQPIDVRIRTRHLDLDTENPVAGNARAAIAYIRDCARKHA